MRPNGPIGQKRILVTGASGFIGKRTLPGLLERGFEVHAISRTPADGPSEIHWHAVDLHDELAVARLVEAVRPTHLLHLAWETTHGTYYDSVANLRWLRTSLHLVQRCVEVGCVRTVGAGTAAEYDLSVRGPLVEDVTPLRPNGLYGTCKKALHEVSAGLAATRGSEHAWGRIFFVFGPREDPARMVPTLLAKLLRDPARIPFQAALGLRDYVYVDDVADAFVALADSRFQGPVNIGSGRPIVLRDLVSRLGEVAGRPNAFDFGALPTPTYEPASVVADVTRANAQLGWQPRRSLDEAIRRTVEWWRERAA